MNDIIIKVERKRIQPVFIVSIILSILFLSILIISIIYDLLGYTLYLLIILLILLTPIFFEYRWLNKINVTFTNSKLLLDILVIKKVTDKNKPKWYYPFKGRIRRYNVTRYAVIENVEINYNDIEKFEIIKNRDLEITVNRKKFLIMSGFYYYQTLLHKWKSKYKQFTKEQVFFMYDELKKRMVD